MASYTFRKFTRADYPMFEHWLNQPHIDGWWDSAGVELRLIEEDMEKDIVQMHIALHDGTPFAYIQDYNAHAFDAPHYKDYPDTARAIDTFLGDPAYLGKGHGSGYIAARISELHRDYPVILTDPDPANLRAIKAYTRAGFRPRTISPCEDGDPVQVMSYP